MASRVADGEPPNRREVSRRRAHIREGYAHESGWQSLGWCFPALRARCPCFSRAPADQEQGSGSHARDARFEAATCCCSATGHARRPDRARLPVLLRVDRVPSSFLVKLALPRHAPQESLYPFPQRYAVMYHLIAQSAKLWFSRRPADAKGAIREVELPSSQPTKAMVQYVPRGPIAQRLEQSAHNSAPMCLYIPCLQR